MSVMNRYRIRWLPLGVGIIGFVLWEVAKHVLLMNVPMLTYHVASVLMDGLIALMVTALMIRQMEVAEKHRREAERIAQRVKMLAARPRTRQHAPETAMLSAARHNGWGR